MRKYKRHLAQNKKLYAALAVAISLGLNCPAYAADAVTVGSGTEDSPVEGENPRGTTVDNAGKFSFEGARAKYVYFYGMAALNPSASADGGLTYTGTTSSFAGNYATLTNNGVIRLSYQDIYSAYADQLKTLDDKTKNYDAIMGRGLLAGTYSTIINNGQIYMNFDEEESTSALFFHGMFVSNNGTAINNGLLSITGQGSSGADVRGVVANARNGTMINNGEINIEIDRAETSRALASTGIGSTLVNNGKIYNKTNGTNYGMSGTESNQLTNNGTIDVIVDTTNERGTAYGNFQALDAIAIGMAVQGGGGLDSDNNAVYKPITNTGVINVSVTGNNPDADSTAVGMLLLNRNGTTADDKVDSGYWDIANTGIINTSSVVTPSADNNYIVRASEVGINLMDVNSAINSVQARVGDWATTLRDFGSTNDLILVRRASADTDKENAVSIDFSNANLILRPYEGYTAGTAYEVSANTLITSVDNDTSEYTVSGMDTMQISSEMSDFITPSVTTVSDGVYNVSLVPNNTGNTKKLISAAAMTGVDFARANIDQISHELERNDRLQQKWFITPYYSKFKRDEGMSGHAHGFIAGSDWKVGEKSFVGIHAAYALGGADKGVYSADAKLKSFLGGLHWTIYPNEDKNWIRTQATYFHNSGDTSYTMNTDTSTLNGKSSNKSDGFYLSANYGFKNELSEQNELRTELGLSYLNMSDSPTIHWNLMDNEISGYNMNFDKYNALHATAKTSLIHNFNDDGSWLFSLGVRGRLAGEKVKMNMMNTDFNNSVREDSVQGLVELSYRHKFNKLYVDAGYQGILGKDNKNHLFHTALKWSF